MVGNVTSIRKAVARPATDAELGCIGANVTALRPTPDLDAQGLWHEVSNASDEIGNLITQIPGEGVRGEETRNELQQALDLLEQATAVLEETVARYEKWTNPDE